MTQAIAENLHALIDVAAIKASQATVSVAVAAENAANADLVTAKEAVAAARRAPADLLDRAIRGEAVSGDDILSAARAESEAEIIERHFAAVLAARHAAVLAARSKDELVVRRAHEPALRAAVESRFVAVQAKNRAGFESATAQITRLARAAFPPLSRSRFMAFEFSSVATERSLWAVLGEEIKIRFELKLLTETIESGDQA